jgi:hypothetical protein
MTADDCLIEKTLPSANTSTDIFTDEITDTLVSSAKEISSKYKA